MHDSLGAAGDPPAAARDNGPLQRSLPLFDALAGPGRPPLTSRSGNSSNIETPRTGGGYTARSSGNERGTPRDPQRLALGERPPARGADFWAAGAPMLSPQHTARSASVSSEQWSSMTPSSLGSSRSRSDSGGIAYAYAPEYDPAPRTSEHEPHRYQMDLLKSLEVMRFVIMKENYKLKELVSEAQERVSELNDQLGTPEPLPEVLPAPEACRVEWHVHSPDVSNAASNVDGPEACSEVRSSFTLTRFPHTSFALEFYPRAASDAADSHPGGSCELALDVHGGRGSRLDLRIGLLLEMRGEHGEQLQSASSSQIVLHGDGRTSCVCSWPVCAAVSLVVCRIDVEEVHWTAGRLCLQSTWPR